MASRRANDDVSRFRWRVAVVEDHLLQRHGVVGLLASQPGVRVVVDCESVPQFLAWLDRVPPSRRPHLLVLDLHVDRGTPANPEVVRRLVRHGMRVLVLSALGSPSQVRAMLRAGVTGVVSKRDSAEDILTAVWAVLAHDQWLTPELDHVLSAAADRPELSDQETRALALYASGHTLDAVAVRLGIQRGTVKKYISRVKAKYAAVGRPARTKVDLHRVAREDGLLGDPASWS